MLKYLSLVLILRRLIDATFLIMAVLLVFPASFFRVFARIFKKQVLHFNPFRNTPPCVFKKKHDIVKIEGFTLKEYQCDTEDNVCVSFWRIIPEESIEIDEDKYSTYVKLKKRKPVLIQHGLLDCSMSWFLLQKSENCLPFILARKGYDVWVSNNRGTKYSSKNNHQDQYWQYNLDHIVKYDVPSIINFVINQTRSDKIIYIGHSQGTTQFFTALDIHPQLGSKIECFIGLGPVLSLKNVNNHLYLKLLDKLKICQVLKFLGFKALLTLSPWMNRLVGFMLSNSWIFYKICQRIVSGICGQNKQPNKVDALRFSVILSHQPGGSSVNNVIHWVQIYRHGYIRKFDYGMKKNKEIYGSAIPPSYSYDSLNKMPFQFHLFRGTSDHIITDKDFKYLTQKLPEQKFQVYHVQDFAHLDYLWAQQAPKLIYQKILKILNQNNQQNEKQNQVDLQQTKDMTQDNSDKSENSYLSKVDVV